jgi:hypothetical protein
MIDKNRILIEVTQNICQDKKECTALAYDVNGNEYTISSSYSKDGSGYVNTTLYKEDHYIESSTLKIPTDPLLFPFPVIKYIEKINCNCKDQLIHHDDYKFYNKEKKCSCCSYIFENEDETFDWCPKCNDNTSVIIKRPEGSTSFILNPNNCLQ